MSGSALGYSAAGVFAAGLLAGGLFAAVEATAPPRGEAMNAQEGVYTVPDRSVVCRVRGAGIGCTNGRVLIECENDRCTPYRGSAENVDSPLFVVPNDANEPGVRVLWPGASLNFRTMVCFAEGAYVGCRLMDHLGGFQMNGLFARSSEFDDAPSGWPWDGRRYTGKHMLPGI